MTKLRVIFLAGAFLIAISGFFWLNHPDFSLSFASKRIIPVLGFQITGISEKGNVWLDNDETQPVNIKTLNFVSETQLRSDAQTAWEFFFDGFLFTALPESAIHYTPQTRELILEKGEFYWDKKLAVQKVEISLFKAGNIFRLSASGRIRLGFNSIEIWNFSGQLDFDYNGKFFQLKGLQYLNTKNGNKIPPANLFPAPPFVSPEAETIALTIPNDTIIQFKWKNVQGARNYLLKLYPSSMRDNLLLSKMVAGNSIVLDIMPFIEYSELYWEVAAFDTVRQIESAPAKMGVIRISSSLLKKGLLPQPPQIEVDSLSVSGNMVLIKGRTDPNAQLSVDEVAVQLDSEGKFIHTISYKSIGVKSIVFRVVAPSGLESVFKKQVTIFDEQ
ncbi:MAG: hypothetical protein KJ808_07100 [Acidobacteria bacterium]|nr:hypothetical protein [Acidobacteriota bacterium]MBU4307483.1 hypothetical protein [Acidobacteriota bacterium]MBU4404790.1 hypothetical protein [Acidobacteriota bacterium]MCG2811148.1 hypothetical protein [Candidatus Aminicenantes bacterium]